MASMLDAGEVSSFYDRLAPRYDVLAGVLRRVSGSRRLARRGIRELQLSPGDTVVELGCGTGVNLGELASAVGPGGRIVGVDLSAGMLHRARARAAEVRDVEVELRQGDVRELEWPDDVDGVLATYALEMVPEHDEVVAAAADALAPRQGRLATMGLCAPTGWPDWLVRLGVLLTSPFGVSEAYTHVRPRESVRRHLVEVVHERRLGRALYLSVGVAGPP